MINSFYKITYSTFFKEEKLSNLKSNLRIKKFAILKSPFKHNKSSEYFFLKKYYNNILFHTYSPKTFEILIYKYFFLSNIKFFKIKKQEKGIKNKI